MAKISVEGLKKVAEYDTKVDSRGRITLRRVNGVQEADCFSTTVFEDGTVLLKPRIPALSESAVNKSTRAMLDESIQNAKAGKVGDAFNPEDFDDPVSEKD